MGTDKYKRPKRKNYEKLEQKLGAEEKLMCRIVWLESEIELLQKRINQYHQLREENTRLRIINSRYTGLFAVFMCKCLCSTTKGLNKEPREALNEIYSLSRKTLEGIK